MIVNVVISETDACMNVVLSKAEKHVPYGELVGTAECVTLKLRCRTIRTHYNWLQLSFESDTQFGTPISVTVEV
jgi:hypothetical protein